MRGRQSLFVVYEHFRVDVGTVGVANLSHIMALAWSDADPASFVRSWEQLTATLPSGIVHAGQLREVFFDKFRTARDESFKAAVREYEEFADSHPKKTLDFMLE